MKNTLILIIALAFSLGSACAQKAPEAETVKTVSPEEKAAESALKAGAQMPPFALKDSSGKTVSSDDLLKRNNLVLVFYRGAWCPYCNLYLKKLQENLPQITAKGGQIVAVSIEKPDDSLSVAEKNDLKFTVLSDPNLEVAKKFGIVYQLPQETDDKYKSKGLDVARHNEMDKPELPLGSTYIVDQQGTIVYAFLDTDYKKRAEPDVIIAELEKIKAAAGKQ